MLVSLNEVLKYASNRQSAVGGFNCATLESARAAVEAAEELGLPMILQHAQVHECYMPLELAAPIMLTLARNASVPVCVHLDHGCTPAYLRRAIELGFTSVMFDASSLPFKENIEKTAEVTAYAHSFGVGVEAELGRMPNGSDKANPEDFYTSAEEAAVFLKKTGVDALAISFGTAHGIYRTKPKLSFDVIKNVAAATNGLPLVMHGGSGVSHEDYRTAISAGIRKINYYTYEALAGGRGIYDAVKKYPEALQFHDAAMAATEFMKKDVAIAMSVFAGIENKGVKQ